MFIGKVLLSGIPASLKDYLESLPEGQVAVPVYYRDDVSGQVYFISDYTLTNVKEFEKSAPAGLYRGGALLELLTKQGRVVIYDERYKWIRMIGGIARYSEGGDLIKTAIRESVVEELTVLTNGEKTRLVPCGTIELTSHDVEGWGITVDSIEETGSISVVKRTFNEANHAFELVVRWDISDCDDLIILHSEDWFRGGRSGFVPFVINDKGEIIGLYDGRHGYMSLPVETLHPTLAEVLSII
ncbi:MAG: hypothetical protein WCG91_03260 [Candidatus Shapirobacteria bacterium]